VLKVYTSNKFKLDFGRMIVDSWESGCCHASEKTGKYDRAQVGRLQ